MCEAVDGVPLITVVVPSFNQGAFLEQNLQSIFSQNLPLEVFVMDGGSTDNSLEIIQKWQSRLAGWRSRQDDGQSSAINEGVALGTSEYVLWLNSDDIFVNSGLVKMFQALKACPEASFVYAEAFHIDAKGAVKSKYLTFPFSSRLFANYCFICQPATLIRRSCWEAAGGLNTNLHMAMDYDLWWKLVVRFGPPLHLKEVCAANRVHAQTKTMQQVDLHYDESIAVVQRYYGSVPMKWHFLRPVMRLFRRLIAVKMR